MKKHFRYGLFFALGAMLALGFVACGDESSSGPSKNEETGIETEVSSSSENDEAISSSSDKDEKSSSSKKVESSSSKKKDDSSSSAKNKESSSSGKVESSSSKDDVSSSSQNVQSSSSDKPVESSSSKAKSSSSEISSSSVKPAESSSSEYSSSSLQETSSSSSEESSSSSFVGCVMGSLYDDRDDKTYKTVKIGEQEWMAENLNFNYKKGNVGSARSYCYNKEDENCDKFGRLYPWTAAIDSAYLDSAYGMKCGFHGVNCSIPEHWRGVCPENWHLPTNEEWMDLILYVGNTDNAGKKLKSSEEWNEKSNDTRGTDDVCFSALPAGYRSISSEYYDLGNYTNFWSVDYYDEKNAYKIGISNNVIHLSLRTEWTSNAFSVRCIKN